MRDTVIVVAPGRLQRTVGIITGIEGDLCRLHVKVLFYAQEYSVYHILTVFYLSIHAGPEEARRPVDSAAGLHIVLGLRSYLFSCMNVHTNFLAKSPGVF